MSPIAAHASVKQAAFVFRRNTRSAFDSRIQFRSAGAYISRGPSLYGSDEAGDRLGTAP